MSTKLKLIAAALAIVTAGTAHAATIDPADFGMVATEGNRYMTVGGEDIRGLSNRVSSVARNGDAGIGRNSVFLSDLTDSSALLVGRTGSASDEDQFGFRNVTGTFDLAVNDLMKDGTGKFRTRFDIYVDGVLEAWYSFNGGDGETVSDMSLGTYALDNQTIAVRVRGIRGATLYDLTVSEPGAVSALAPVPLPAGGLLLLTGLGGMAVMRRRKKA